MRTWRFMIPGTLRLRFFATRLSRCGRPQQEPSHPGFPRRESAAGTWKAARSDGGFMLCCAKLLFPGCHVLIEMRLENYAVIDNLAVEFGQGLNLLTGETGAGKSILVDALALLLGDKASSDVIRAGAERAVVAAVFEAEGAAEKPLAEILESNGLDESDDGSLILRREIAIGGKGRVFVNNQ